MSLTHQHMPPQSAERPQSTLLRPLIPRPKFSRGTHTFPGLGTYTGEWRGGKRHGQGAMAYTIGDRCVGHARALPGASGTGRARTAGGRAAGGLTAGGGGTG